MTMTRRRMRRARTTRTRTRTKMMPRGERRLCFPCRYISAPTSTCFLLPLTPTQTGYGTVIQTHSHKYASMQTHTHTHKYANTHTCMYTHAGSFTHKHHTQTNTQMQMVTMQIYAKTQKHCSFCVPQC